MIDPEEKEEHANLYRYIGLAWSGLENYEETILADTEAIMLNPDDPDNSNNRGYHYHKLERYAESLSDYERAVSLNPEEWIYQKGLGRAQYYLERYERAAETLKIAITLDETMAEPYYYLGLTQEKLGKPEESVSSLQKARELVDPKEQRELSDQIEEKLPQFLEQ